MLTAIQRVAPEDQARSLQVGRGPVEMHEPLVRRATWSGTRSIAVTSGKGGVGKSHFVASLAVGFARRGARVLCVDADLGLASLDLMLGVRPSLDLRDVLAGERRVEDIIVRGPEGVSLLPGCPGRYEMANLSDVERHALRRVLEPLSGSYDVLLVDTGAGLGSNAVSFAASGEEVVLVITQDPASLRDAYAITKVLHVRLGVERIDLVVNAADSPRAARALFDRFDGLCRAFLDVGVSLLGSIPRDAAVPDAVARGEPVVLSSPSSPAARAHEAILRRLLARGDANRPNRDGFWAELLENRGEAAS